MADAEEDMDTSDGSASAQPHEPGVLLTFSLNKIPEKAEIALQRLLQSWFNNNTNKLDCSVEKVLANERVVVKVPPHLAVSKLQELNGRTVTKRGDSVTILSISLTTPTELHEQPAEAAGKAAHPEEEQRQTPVGAQASPGPTDAEERRFGIVSMLHYWYIHNTFKEELQQIIEKTGTDALPEVHVSFVKKHKDGDPGKALNDFMDLVQSNGLEYSGQVVPLKFVDPDQWTDAQDMLNKKENRLLLSASSDEVLVFGPSMNREAMFKCLTSAPQTNSTTASDNGEPEPEDAPLTMTIKDRLLEEGLSVEESYWKQMTASDDGRIGSIQTKFNVDFAATETGQGVVQVKARYRRPAGNASMESHAISALLRLYQKIVTSPLSLSRSLPMNLGADNDDEESTNGFVVVKQPTGEGAAAAAAAVAGGSKKEDACPICLGPFVKKQQLKCKHEFCEDCLKRAEESTGPICPVCREVFGVVEGNQPEGKMTWSNSPSSLPGFPDCGQIIINYKIRDGIQTEKHPNPGQPYAGIYRTAFLPDNKEGNQVLQLLRQAFDQRLIFTIGTSRTTGRDNQVTWNDIHHKTSALGGPQGFGYPDPDYLSRVKDELKAKGIE